MRRCTYCGQALPPKRLNTPMTPVEGRVFDAIARCGAMGIMSYDLVDAVWADGDALAARKSLKVHVHRLNRKLEESGHRIEGADSIYRLRRFRP